MSKERIVKIAFILLLIIAAPFAPEIVVLANVVGAEFAILTLFAFFVMHAKDLQMYIKSFVGECREAFINLASAYLFKPKVYLGHASLSVIYFVIFGSAVISTAVWVPVVLLSAGAFGPVA